MITKDHIPENIQVLKKKINNENESVKEVEIEKKMKADIGVINLDNRYVGGIVTRSDEIDGQGDIIPYNVTREMAHEYMINSRVIEFMHGDVKMLRKFLKESPGVETYQDEKGNEIIGININEYEKGLEKVEKNINSIYGKDFIGNISNVVDSIFISDEFIKLIEDKKLIRGDWYLGTQIENKKVLEKIKNKEIKSYSIAGIGYVEVDKDE